MHTQAQTNTNSKSTAQHSTEAPTHIKHVDGVQAGVACALAENFIARRLLDSTTALVEHALQLGKVRVGEEEAHPRDALNAVTSRQQPRTAQTCHKTRQPTKTQQAQKATTIARKVFYQAPVTVDEAVHAPARAPTKPWRLATAAVDAVFGSGYRQRQPQTPPKLSTTILA